MDRNHHDSFQQASKEEVLYTKSVLQFLRNKLDDFTIDCFRLVVKNHKHGGLVKTKMVEDYFKRRASYDRSFYFLEAQGFIENSEYGNMKPYIITPRGEQLISILKDEKQKKNLENSI